MHYLIESRPTDGGTWEPGDGTNPTPADWTYDQKIGAEVEFVTQTAGGDWATTTTRFDSLGRREWRIRGITA